MLVLAVLVYPNVSCLCVKSHSLVSVFSSMIMASQHMSRLTEREGLITSVFVHEIMSEQDVKLTISNSAMKHLNRARQENGATPCRWR
ncbi:JK_54P [Escherichia phage Jk06]|uniref:JK_54P n=1 Tax=Escherichia phage Jk06 TaxID=2886922 RepID=Q45PW2_9CAUD|nr:hypothetical protein JK_54 [Escherichia phage Jk06]AAZ29304.1 JK_54P [Escherichia phage Jk06]